MVIKGGRVLNDEFEFVGTDVTIDNDIISKIGETATSDIDASDCYVVPGFIDTHFHNACGYSFIDFVEGSYEVIAKYEAQHGTTTIVPAIAAAPKEKLLNCIDYANRFVNKEFDGCANMPGFHLEGPFFSEVYKGAHLPENIRNPEIKEFMEYVKRANGSLKIMTMAPELPNSDEVIKAAVENNVCISIGHTNATMEDVFHAVNMGAAQGTHLFNAMSGLNHRKPGTVGGILFSSAKAELICDLFHVNGNVVKMVYKLKGREGINMVTDSATATGLSDGEYMENGRKIFVKNNVGYTEDGTISGSGICMVEGVRNLVSLGIPLEDACMMASKNPAQTINEYDTVGSITVGKRADIVVLNNDLSIKHVILRGKVIN